MHVSIIGFDDGSEAERNLDGDIVQEIYANLKSGVDVTQAQKLRDNINIAFQGVTPMGQFEISKDLAVRILRSSGNPNGLPNSDVLRRWASGKDLIEGKLDSWVIDFGCATSEHDASLYQEPFEYVKDHILPARERGETEEAVAIYWLHWRPRPNMRDAIKDLARFIVTPRVSKHRLFIWVTGDWLPSDTTVAIARSDDYSFGVLHSRVHEVWARAKGTQLREVESGFRYTPQTCFETFPFPTPTPSQSSTIADIAKALDSTRSNWLNPPEWTHEEVTEFRGSLDGPWSDYLRASDSNHHGIVLYRQQVSNSELATSQLADRTLTNLYNARPTWLDRLHQKLDHAVLDSYGWPHEISDQDLLVNLLVLNLEREPATPR